MKEITINAPAKLNFGLQVLNKRSDNYHNINTVFIKIGIYDTLSFEKATKFHLKSSPEINIPQEENIIYKTLQKLSHKFNIPEILNQKIFLKKNIPMGAGMGGGSSNCAATIIAANKMFDLTDNSDVLNNLAVELGADVPFFLNKGDAVGKGIGEQLEYFNFRLPYHILVIFPNINISTPMAYKALNRDNTTYEETDFKSIINNFIFNKIDIKKIVYNDFEKPVFSLHKEISLIKNELYNYGAEFALLTGSGSAVFGLFSERKDAEKVGIIFDKYRTFITKKV